MNAIFDKLHILPNYDSIKESVEYEILQMYSYSIICLLKNKQNFPKEEILSCLLCLNKFRVSKISEGYDNKYIQEKIPKEEIEIMKLNDDSPHKLYEAIA